MAQISLGQLVNVNGRAALQGGSSGLDTKSLIDNLASIKRLPAVTLETEVTENTDKITALGRLQVLLDDIKSAVNFLRSPPGINNEDEDVFKFKTVSTSINSSNTVAEFVNITASPGALQTSFDLQVANLAQRKIQTSDAISVADKNTSVTGAGQPFAAGTLKINGQDVNLVDGDTLNNIADKINAVSNDSGVAATIIKTATNQFRLQLSASETGTDADFDINIASNTGVGGVTENLAFTDTQAAENAQISINGINIVSQNNTIDDAIENITFNLRKKTAAGETISATVRPDSDLILNGIIGFVNAYNAFKTFEAEQNVRNADGSAAEGSTLINSKTLEIASDRISNDLNRIISGLSDANSVFQIRDITNPDAKPIFNLVDFDNPADERDLTVRNLLEVRTEDLKDLIDKDVDFVKNIFAFNSTSNDVNFQVFSSGTDQGINNFAINIDSTNGIATADYTDADGNLQKIDLDFSSYGAGANINGRDGTILEGFSFVFSSKTDTTVNFSFTQGIGDSLFNTLDKIADETFGIVKTEVDILTKQNTDIQEDIKTIDERVERYRERLVAEYSALEAVITKANSTLSLLDAIFGKKKK